MKQKLLFIGGWTRNKASYKRVWESIPDKYEVLFLASDEVTDHAKTHDIADFIKQFLVDNNVEECIVAGHSLGGGLAIEFASKYPKMISQLVLIDSSGIKSSHKASQKMKAAVKNQFIFFEIKAKENFTTFFRILMRPVKNYKSMAYAYSCDVKHKMKNVPCRTLILWGELDHIFPISQAEEIHKSISRSKVIVLPGMDHDWVVHSPELLWNNISKMDNELAK